MLYRHIPGSLPTLKSVTGSYAVGNTLLPSLLAAWSHHSRFRARSASLAGRARP
jgi:hypothetical protein